MARFILDVNTIEIEKVLDVINHFFESSSITCIDRTNTAQFYEQTQKNKLTTKQIKNFNNNLDK
tara:strand:+ start:413 stop:604 length:192 start_codon:yes stop_codon:yes gene_type:complete